MYNNHYETTLCFYLLMFLLQMYNIHYISLHCKLFSDWFKSENSQKSRYRIKKNLVSPFKIIDFCLPVLYWGVLVKAGNEVPGCMSVAVYIML